MGARKAKFEAAREALFATWKAALTAAKGNVTRAAAICFPDAEPGAARNRGNKLTHKLGLADYAKGLREQATGHSRGRPWPKTNQGSQRKGR